MVVKIAEELAGAVSTPAPLITEGAKHGGLEEEGVFEEGFSPLSKRSREGAVCCGQNGGDHGGASIKKKRTNQTKKKKKKDGKE